MNVLAERFSDLSDPREDGKVIYPLTDVLVIAVCAAIAGAESYEDIVLYGTLREEQNVLARRISGPGKWHSFPRHVSPGFRSDRPGRL